MAGRLGSGERLSICGEFVIDGNRQWTPVAEGAKRKQPYNLPGVDPSGRKMAVGQEVRNAPKQPAPARRAPMRSSNAKAAPAAAAAYPQKASDASKLQAKLARQFKL